MHNIQFNNNIIQDPVLIRNGFNSNLLHFKPLSKYLDEGTSHLALALDKFLDRKFAHLPINSPIKFFQKFFTRTFHAIGGALTGTVAAVEIAASTALAAVALTAALITKGKYSKLNKFASKVVAYDVECFFRLLNSINKILYKNFPKLHTEIAVSSELIHIIAASVGLGVNSILQSLQSSHDYTPAFVVLGIEALIAGLPHAIRSIMADLGGHNGVMNGIRNLNQISEQNREILLNAFRDLNIRALSNPNYLEDLVIRLRPVFNELLQNQNLNVVIDNSIRIEPDGDSRTQYNNHVYQCTKDAYNRILGSEEYLKCLSPNNDSDDGRDNLEDFDATVTIPLAGIAQLIEIETIANGGAVKCPTEFNDRHTRVLAVSEKLKRLNDDEKAELHKKILKSSDYTYACTIRDRVLFDEIARDIGQLSSSLHQGTLFRGLQYDRTNGAQHVNFFTKAWQDAVNEAI